MSAWVFPLENSNGGQALPSSNMLLEFTSFLYRDQWLAQAAGFISSFICCKIWVGL